MRIYWGWLLIAALAVGAAWSEPGRLDLYFIDVMGGGATLIVTPAGESILIDAGWDTDDNRDARRIFQALMDAGREQIDHCVITHWHRDHFGAIGALNRMTPIQSFYDKGLPETFADDPEHFPALREKYVTASRGQATELHAGDALPLEQAPGAPELTIVCVAVNRTVLASSPGQSLNPHCQACEMRGYDASDNANSIALWLSYGNFQCFLGGDLTWNVEAKLVCPFDILGEADLLPLDHHGFDSSNNPVLLQTLNPTVAVFCNGPEKGRAQAVMEQLHQVPDLKAVYQIHKSVQLGGPDPIADEFVANPSPEPGGRYLKASIAPDGNTFTMTLGGGEYPKTFECK